MSIIQINRDTCSKCGLCVTECPTGIIMQKPEDYPVPHRVADMMCIRCGHCVAVCPTGSLSHQEMPVENCPPFKKELIPDLEQVTHLMRTRRSVRVYQNLPVSREVLQKGIEIARYSPTGHNDQSVNWLIVDSPQEMKRLVDLGADWTRWIIKNQPEMSALFNFPKMLRDYENGHDKFLREAPVVIMTYAAKDSPMAVIDCVSAMTYFDLAAQDLGLGCCWCGFALIAANTFPPMMEFFHLPDNQRIYGCLMAGYPRYGYQRLPERKKPGIVWR
jgi:nitroreductase/NAD-dependent dihydropyrimidine dehydrogenase PreA subunit